MVQRLHLLGFCVLVLCTSVSARASGLSFGSWSTSTSLRGVNGVYMGVDYSENQNGVGAPHGSVGTTLNSQPPSVATVAAEAMLSDPFQMTMVDQPITYTIQTLRVMAKTSLVSAALPGGAGATVHFSVTEPVPLAFLSSGSNLPFDSFTGPAGFNWVNFQGPSARSNGYHLLPVGDYTVTSSISSTHAGVSHSQTNDVTLYFIVPEPASASLAISGGLMLLGRRRRSC